MKIYRNEQTDKVDGQNVQNYSKILICMYICKYVCYIFTYTGLYVKVRVYNHSTILIFITNIYQTYCK